MTTAPSGPPGTVYMLLGTALVVLGISRKQVSSSFEEWGVWGSERLGNMSYATQSVKDQARIEPE